MKLSILVAEVKEKALKQVSGNETERTEATLLKELEYYRELEKRMDGIPLHVAINAYLATTPTNKMKPAKVGDLKPRYLNSILSRGLSSGYKSKTNSYLDHLDCFSNRDIHTVLSDELETIPQKLDIGA